MFSKHGVFLPLVLKRGENLIIAKYSCSRSLPGDPLSSFLNLIKKRISRRDLFSDVLSLPHFLLFFHSKGSMERDISHNQVALLCERQLMSSVVSSFESFDPQENVPNSMPGGKYHVSPVTNLCVDELTISLLRLIHSNSINHLCVCVLRSTVTPWNLRVTKKGQDRRKCQSMRRTSMTTR